MLTLRIKLTAFELNYVSLMLAMQVLVELLKKESFDLIEICQMFVLIFRNLRFNGVFFAAFWI